MSALPASAARLFPGGEPLLDAAGGISDFAILRLLEDGDSTELAALAQSAGRARLASAYSRLGGRKLSARSRRFWALALGAREPERAKLAEALWPLA